jgi:hypothetical protein
MSEVVKGIKGFDKDLKCRGYQFEIGKHYEEEEAIICNAGFHFCGFPLDVFKYYPPTHSRYAEVEGSGETDRNEGGDSKVSVTKLHVKAELTLGAVIDSAVKFIMSRIDWKNQKKSSSPRSTVTNEGCFSATVNAGSRSVATNTGDRSAATNMGYRSVAASTGDWSPAANAGYRSVATSVGDQSVAANTGICSIAANTGDRSAATNINFQSVAANTGNCSVATNTGICSIAANTGDQSASANAGHQSAAASTGHQSTASVEGEESIAIAIGYESKAKGALGCWLVLAEWSVFEDDDVVRIIDVQSVRVDGEIIKANTYYQLIDGTFVEVG